MVIGRRSRPLLVVVVLLALSLTAPARAEQPPKQPHILYQTSIIDALLLGGYDGAVTIGDLRRHGDFGLGTVNGLDGELVGLDGRFFQVRADGSVHLLDDVMATPFAVVTFFRPQARADLPPSPSLAAFTTALDRRLVTTNTVVAVRVHGRFPYIKARSVPRQEPPYRPLAQVVDGQSVFEFTDVAGTLVGFRTPAYFRGLNVPGYHLHFISDDRRRGGHVLDLHADAVSADLDYADSVQVDLPQDAGFRALGLGEDLSGALHKVEQ